MSTHLIVDEKEEEENLEAQETGEELETEINAEDNLPEKLRNKSREEIADMYTNLEKRLGSQGNELGELRRLTDRILQDQLDRQESSKKKETEVSDDDFFENPRDAVKKVVSEAVSSNEKLNKLDVLERQLAQQQFYSRHPDAGNVVQSDEFKDWVSKSQVRVNLYQRADQYDIDAANNLLDLWKEHQEIIKGVAAEEKNFSEQKRKKALKAASSESGSTDVTTKPTFRRQDLIRMRIEDPQKYSAMQPEIMLAYQEGRVK